MSRARNIADTGDNNLDDIVVDGSGNVGIGTSSPQATAEISGGLDNRLRINSTDGTTSNNYGIDFSTAGTVRSGIRYNAGNNYLAFYGFNNTERMRIDSGGSLRLGTTGTEGVTNRLTVKFAGGGTEYGMVMKPAVDTTVPIYFQNASGGNVGSINITASSTSYNTTSDYRLKENVTDISDATTRLKQLNPVRFNFISNPEKVVDGFLAHEVEDVVPEAITGTKDAMRDEGHEVTPAVLDEDGNVVTEAVMGTRSVPDYQGIDQSKLVPLLTAALQEALTKIDDLETRLAALENV